METIGRVTVAETVAVFNMADSMKQPKVLNKQNVMAINKAPMRSASGVTLVMIAPSL